MREASELRTCGRVLLLAALMQTVSLAAGQEAPTGLEDMRDANRRELAPGLTASAAQEIEDRLPRPSWIIEIDTWIGIASPGVRLAPKSPWMPEPLGDGLRALDSPVGIALFPEPPAVAEPWVPGLVFAEGRLLGWPARGKVLVQSTEGTLDIIDAPSAPRGALILQDGMEVPVACLNGLPLGDSVSIISGPFSRSLAPTALFPAGTQAILLQPGPSNPNSARSIWDRESDPASRSWTPAGVRDASLLAVDNDQLAVIIPPSMPRQISSMIAKHNSLIVDLELEPQVVLSLFACDVGQSLPLDGGLPQEEAPQDAMAAIGLDDSGRRLWIMETGAGDSRRPALPAKRLASTLRAMGATRAVLMPESLGRLLPGEVDRSRTAAMEKLKARAILGATVQGPSLSGEGGERLRRLVPLVTAASNLNQEIAGPEALLDGRVGFDPSLNHLWVAQPDENGNLPWVELRLPAPAKVRAIDLVHAETCGFSPEFDLKGYRLRARGSASEAWSNVGATVRDSPAPRERIGLPPELGAVEWLRLEVTDPAFQPGCRTARLGEIVVWGAP